MQTIVIESADYQPVSLLQMRQWCRLEDDDTSQDIVLSLIRAALTEDAEKRTLRAFVQRRYRSYMDRWPVCSEGIRITLPHAPLVSVEQIQYRDLDGNLQTLATNQYVVHAWREPGIIVPEWNVSWPSIRSVPDAVQVEYTAGYGIGSPSDEAAHQENIPENLKLWMASKALTIFDKRDQLVIGTIVTAVPRDFTDGLLDNLVLGTRIA